MVPGFHGLDLIIILLVALIPLVVIAAFAFYIVRSARRQSERDNQQ